MYENLDVSNHVRKLNGFTVRCRIKGHDKITGRASYSVRVCKAGKIIHTASWFSPSVLTEAIDSPKVISDLCQRAVDEVL